MSTPPLADIDTDDTTSRAAPSSPLQHFSSAPTLQSDAPPAGMALPSARNPTDTAAMGPPPTPSAAARGTLPRPSPTWATQPPAMCAPAPTRKRERDADDAEEAEEDNPSAQDAQGMPKKSAQGAPAVLARVNMGMDRRDQMARYALVDSGFPGPSAQLVAHEKLKSQAMARVGKGELAHSRSFGSGAKPGDEDTGAADKLVVHQQSKQQQKEQQQVPQQTNPQRNQHQFAGHQQYQGQPHHQRQRHPSPGYPPQDQQHQQVPATAYTQRPSLQEPSIQLPQHEYQQSLHAQPPVANPDLDLQTQQQMQQLMQRHAQQHAQDQMQPDTIQQSPVFKHEQVHHMQQTSFRPPLPNNSMPTEGEDVKPVVFDPTAEFDWQTELVDRVNATAARGTPIGQQILREMMDICVTAFMVAGRDTQKKCHDIKVALNVQDIIDEEKKQNIERDRMIKFGQRMLEMAAMLAGDDEPL